MSGWIILASMAPHPNTTNRNDTQKDNHVLVNRKLVGFASACLHHDTLWEDQSCALIPHTRLWSVFWVSPPFSDWIVFFDLVSPLHFLTNRYLFRRTIVCLSTTTSSKVCFLVSTEFYKFQIKSSLPHRWWLSFGRKIECSSTTRSCKFSYAELTWVLKMSN